MIIRLYDPQNLTRNHPALNFENSFFYIVFTEEIANKNRIKFYQKKSIKHVS